MAVAAMVAAAQVAAMAAVAVTLAAAIAVVMTAAMRAVIAALVAAIRVVVTAATLAALATAAPVANARLIAHPVRIRQRQRLMQRHVRLIVRQWIVHVMAKIARLQHSIVTRLRVVKSLIVASVVLRHVKIAHRLGTVRIVQRSLIVRIGVGARSVAARVTVTHVQPGAVLIALRRVANIRTQRQRNVVNSHRVLSVVIVPVMTICRFSGQLA